MKQMEFPVRLTQWQEQGLDLMRTVGLVGCLDVWRSSVDFLLKRQNSWIVDILCDFALVAVMALALIAWDEAGRWIKIHAPSSEPQPPSEGLSHVQKLARSRKLGLIMLGYVLVGFAAGLLGFVSCIEFYRSEPRAAPGWFPMLSGVAFFIWVLVVYRYGFVLFDALSRRFGSKEDTRTPSLVTPNSDGI